MLFQKSMKFYSVINFEENGMTLNYKFFSIFFDETLKFETCMNIYS